jgi:hypothetical protein
MKNPSIVSEIISLVLKDGFARLVDGGWIGMGQITCTQIYIVYMF